MTKRETHSSIKRLNEDSAKFEYTIARMNAGMPDDARKFLKWCARCMTEGVAIPPAFADALASRLMAIAECPNPFDKALLKRGRGGGKRLELFDMKQRVAGEMWLAHNAGKTLDEAAEIVVKRYHGNEAVPEWLRELTVERARDCYTDFRPIFDGEDTESVAARIDHAGDWTTTVPEDAVIKTWADKQR
jgi:hypothetical protein